MKYWATEFFSKTAGAGMTALRGLVGGGLGATRFFESKTAGPFLSGAVGGLPYSFGERSTLYKHPEMSAQEQENLPNQFARIPAAIGRSIPLALGSGLGGALLGATLGGVGGALFGPHGHADITNGSTWGGAIGGGLGGAIGGGVGMYRGGRDLAEEEIKNQKLLSDEQESLWDRHPIATLAGVPLLGLNAAASVANPASLIGRAGAGIVSSIAGHPSHPEEQIRTIRQR